MRKISAFLAVALMSLAFTASAFGQSATEDAYGGIAGTQSFNGGESVLAAESSSGSSLPFTGLDVGLIVLAGIALVGTGVAVRRFSHPSVKP